MIFTLKVDAGYFSLHKRSPGAISIEDTFSKSSGNLIQLFPLLRNKESN